MGVSSLLLSCGECNPNRISERPDLHIEPIRPCDRGERQHSISGCPAPRRRAFPLYSPPALLEHRTIEWYIDYIVTPQRDPFDINAQTTGIREPGLCIARHRRA